MSRPSRILAPLCLFATLFLWGCGKGEKDNLVPVTGKVTYGGKALTRGSVSFRADKARGNTDTAEPYGDIAEDGTYTLYTNKKPGAPVGKYVVIVVSTAPIDPESTTTATPKSLIPEKYSDTTKPMIQVDIVADPKEGKYNIELSDK